MSRVLETLYSMLQERNACETPISVMVGRPDFGGLNCVECVTSHMGGTSAESTSADGSHAYTRS